VIAIVHYGLGNIQAIADIYKRLGVQATLATSPADLRGADRIILPGVGAFDWAMSRLGESGMREALDEAVLEHKKPVLGICVGMQMLARRSDEGGHPGLGWIAGEVRRFDVAAFSDPTHLPHMGWNDVKPRAGEPLLRDLEKSRFYFLHSYYFAPDSPDAVLCETDYNGVFASAVRSANIYGVQFHPEKSHKWGVTLLKNFAEL
jgi:glutamine amidotransferase